MNKSELAEALSRCSSLGKKRAEQVVVALFAALGEALANNERVEIRGFGSLYSKAYRARAGRNPKTGEIIEVCAKRLPVFKVGKALRKQVDLGESDAPAPSKA